LRYLQVTLSVLTRDEDTLEQLKLNTPVIQNALIILLGSYDFAALESQEGKEELRKTSESEIVGLFPNEEIESVLFTGFVIQ
jgi:flagellar basal body-associated protein FliL